MDALSLGSEKSWSLALTDDSAPDDFNPLFLTSLECNVLIVLFFHFLHWALHTPSEEKKSARGHMVATRLLSHTSFIIHKTHISEIFGNPSWSSTHYSTEFFLLHFPLWYLLFGHKSVTDSVLHFSADVALHGQCICYLHPGLFDHLTIFITAWKSHTGGCIFWLTQPTALPCCLQAQ